MRGLLKADRFAELADAVADAEGEPLADEAASCRRSPIPRRSSASASTTAAHAEETKQEIPRRADDLRQVPERPGGARTPPSTLPAASEKVDYEAEVCAVIGRRLKEVGPEEALDGVAGYTLMNDLSARDLQLATTQWMAGKTFDGAAPCGPALVTADEVEPRRDRVRPDA